jgi:hypothetical protein
MRQAHTYPKGVAKERKLTFPIKLRCTSSADLCHEPGLEDAQVSVLVGTVPLFAVNRIELSERYELPPLDRLTRAR